MKKRSTALLVALIALVVLPSSVFAWTAVEKSIKVRFAQIQLFVNGKQIETSAEPFIYNGNVYAPVATIANALGIAWQWDNHTPAVRFFDKEHQLMEENYISGHLQAYPLGNDYYFYYDTGYTYIHKGLRFQDKNGFEVSVPIVRKEGYVVSEQFGVPYPEFIDMDRDGKKEELLVMYYLSPEDQAEPSTEYEIHVLKLMDERTFEDIGAVMKDKQSIRFHFNDDKGWLFATYFDLLFQPERIEVYQWKQDHVELFDTFVKTAE